MIAASVGPFARRFLDRHRAARVSAVFARSFHLEADDGALCAVSHALGDGALNVRLSQELRGNGAIVAGAEALIDDDRITVGAAVVDARSATPWRPSPHAWSTRSPVACDALFAKALQRAPRDGAFRAALDSGFAAGGMMQRALQAKARGFLEWLHLAIVMDEHAETPDAPIAGLIGLGSGLTPAGDDFVGGAMIALRWRDRGVIADRLAHSVQLAASGSTTILSAAMLRAASEGYGGATLHEILDAIGEGDSRRAIDLLDAVDRIGHTSGWDALAGALAALRS